MDIEFNVQPTKQESKDEGKDEGEERKRKDMEGAEKTIKRVKRPKTHLANVFPKEIWSSILQNLDGKEASCLATLNKEVAASMRLRSTFAFFAFTLYSFSCEQLSSLFLSEGCTFFKRFSRLKVFCENPLVPLSIIIGKFGPLKSFLLA